MKSFLTFITLSCSIHFGYCQKNGVTIIEEPTPKRIFLYAKNNSEIPKVVFLKVDAIGFRRRSDRPLIKIIPPKSKELLTTLIPLTNVESKYNYTYIVNNELENIHAINMETKK